MSVTDDQLQLEAAPKQKSLLGAVDWGAIDAQVRLQQRSRERDTPPISMFRWWARRSHALIGALLEQVRLEDQQAVISDPFSGGGTVAIEAARRRLSVYAQDLHPWPVAGLRSSLTAVDPEQLEQASEGLLKRLAPLRAQLYGTACPKHGSEAELLGCFWVRVRDCPACSRPVHLFPYPMVSRASRKAKETHSWWGCSACGQVTNSADDHPDRCCAGCGRKFPPISHPLLCERLAVCPHGRCGHRFAAFVEEPPSWKCVLVQRLCRVQGRLHVHLAEPTPEEIVQATDRKGLIVPAPLREEIRQGLETRVLRRAGIERWEQLHAARQLRILVAGSQAIESMRLSAAVRDRLRLSLAGCAEMAGHVSRWDRFYPKAFEAMANHRFAITGFSYETNLLAERGRGSLPRRLLHSQSAARWSEEELSRTRRVRRLSNAGPRQLTSDVLLAQGTSARQLPRDGSVDLVLTDPPYFDDVQYAELAGIFFAWARAIKLLPDSAELDLRTEAVANATRNVGAEEYRQLLLAILAETRRTLNPEGGRVILTYHNTDLKAWWALGRALREAGFAVCALAVTYAENERDHAKRNRLGFSRDLVLECRPRRGEGEPEVVWYEHDEPEARELMVAGRALASMPACETAEAFGERFRELRGQLRPVRIGRRAGDDEKKEIDA